MHYYQQFHLCTYLLHSISHSTNVGKMVKRIFIFFAVFMFLFNIQFGLSRKVCSVVQFGYHTLLTNKDSNKMYKHKVCTKLESNISGVFILCNSKNVFHIYHSRFCSVFQVVGVIDPFDKNNVLWMRKKRNKKFNLNIFKKLYDSFCCNINDYVNFPNEDQFIFRIFHINLKVCL